jgi:hypothetical protein
MKKIRSSALNHAQICPGTLVLAKAAADENIRIETPYTALGTAAHKYLELRITSDEKAADEALNGLPTDLRLTMEEFWIWLELTDIVPALCRADSAEIFVEQGLSYQLGDLTITGTIDLLEIQGPAGWVVDWKLYNDPSQLPPIGEDLQMYSYGIAAAENHPELTSITVHRVLIYHQRAETLILDREMINLAKEAIAIEAKKMVSGEFVPGAHCTRCLHRTSCKQWARQGDYFETREMRPYEGGDFNTEADVLRFLLAVPVIEKRLIEGKEAAKRFVLNSGRPVADLASGSFWGYKQTKRDEIVDSAGCLFELVRETSQKDALSAAKTTKKGIDSVLKQAKMPLKNRREFIDHLRRLGYIKTKEIEDRYGWDKKKIGKTTPL